MRILAITGAGQGIGRATAQHFARHGYAVSFCDLDAQAGAEALADLATAKAQAIFEQADAGDATDVARWVQRTIAELGVPDVLINNAGLSESGDFLSLPAAQFDRIVNANLRSAFLCSQSFAAHMVQRDTVGCIVNIASLRAFLTEPGWEAYSASKGGMLGLTRAMALSLGPKVRVNAISPGWIEVADWKRSDHAVTPHHSKQDNEQHPVGRVGKPEDIAAACLFLAEHAGFMTGQNLVIDGGMAVQAIYE
jgi:NAD(P)-dependent dehydrogenase (short-subunit alcohol dehydrogenase family)